MLPRKHIFQRGKIKFGLALVTFAIALVIVGLLVASPAVRGPVDLLYGKLVNHDGLYEPTRHSINQTLIGTDYSVMHAPEAGIAVIFNVSKADAMELSDPTTQFVSPNKFNIPPGADYYYNGFTSSGPATIPDLKDCYPLSVPKQSVAAVIADVDVISPDALKAVIGALQERQSGPDQASGAYAIYDNDHDLVKRLYTAGAIKGTLQTAPQLTGLPDTLKVLVVPIDKAQKMDVTVGVDTRGS